MFYCIELTWKARRKWAYIRETVKTIQDIDTIWEANASIFRTIFIRNAGDTDAWIMSKGYYENSSDDSKSTDEFCEFPCLWANGSRNDSSQNSHKVNRLHQ